MKRPWQTLFQKLTFTLRERVHLALTTMALRHQLAVLQRSAKRPQFWPADRCLWVLFSMAWERWPDALELVQADTVRRWRRQGLRQLVRWEGGRKRPGRPAIASETRALIRRMRQENVLWGAPRIQGELAMLGIKVSWTTVAKYMVCRPSLPSPSWRTFICLHASELMGREASAELLQRVCTRSARLLMALRWWLDRWVAGERERDSWDGRHGTVILFLPRSDTGSRPRLRTLDMKARAAMSERSPPAFGVSSHSELSVAEPTELGRADVRLASSSRGRVGKYAFIQRPMRAHLKGWKRGDSRRAAT